MQGELIILDRSGHTTVPWDTEVHNGPFDPAIAEAKFKEMVANGLFAFGTDAANQSVQLKGPADFDPELYPKITVAPTFVGG